MKPLTFIEAERLVLSRGWFLHHVRGSHHYYRKAGRNEIVVIPRHPGTLSPGVQRSIMRIAGIRREEL